MLFLCILAPAECQWSSIASNHDGTQVYFVTRLRQEGSAQPLYGKLFIAAPSGIRPLLIRNRDVTPFGVGSALYSTNAYDVIGVDVPPDVSRLAVVATGECHILSAICDGAEIATTTVYDATGTGIDFPGRGRLSPNGEWLSLIEIPWALFGLGPTQASVSNLATNSSSNFSFPNLNSDYKNGSIANNGEFAYGGGTKGLTLKAIGEPITSIANQAAVARLDASGTTLLSGRCTSARVVAWWIATRRLRRLPGLWLHHYPYSGWLLRQLLQPVHLPSAVRRLGVS
jgi:hypothetical protein